MTDCGEGFIMKYPPLLFTIKELNGPWGVAIDSKSDKIYITENKGNSIAVFDSHGDRLRKFTDIASSYGNNLQSLNHPSGITLDDKGYLIVADRYNHCIKKLSEDGRILDVVGTEGTGPYQFSYPTGLTINYVNKRIYIADISNHRVQVLNNDFTWYKQFGEKGRGNGQFIHPSGVCADSNGRVFVVDNGNRRVQIFTEEGDYISKFGSFDEDGELVNPIGIVIDDTDTVYVSERKNKCISKFTSEGKFISYIGGEYLEEPSCLALDNKGRLYVSEFYADTVKIFRKF